MNKFEIQGVITEKTELKTWTTQMGKQGSSITLQVNYSNDYEDFYFKFRFKNKNTALANSFTVGAEVIIQGRLIQEFFKDDSTGEIRPYMVLLGTSIKLANLQGQSQMQPLQSQSFQSEMQPQMQPLQSQVQQHFQPTDRPDLEDDFLNNQTVQPPAIAVNTDADNDIPF